MRHWIIPGISAFVLACAPTPPTGPIVEADRPRPAPVAPPRPNPTPPPAPEGADHGGSRGGGNQSDSQSQAGGGGGRRSSGGGSGPSTGPYAFELTILDGSPMPPDQISVQEASP